LLEQCLHYCEPSHFQWESALALLLPLELLKRRGRVVGLSFAFLAVDWCGAFFSLISTATQAEFDVLFAVACALRCAAIARNTELEKTNK
jgi:hypothetical protein